MNGGFMSPGDDLILKEDQLIRVSWTVIYVFLGGFAGILIWALSLQFTVSSEIKDREVLEKAFVQHLAEGKEYRKLYNRRWLIQNNALIRLQERAGIKVPDSDRAGITEAETSDE